MHENTTNCVELSIHIFQNVCKKMNWSLTLLLVGMLGTVTTCLDCRRPAFFKCTVTQPTVRMAGLFLGIDHRVQAAGNEARAWTTAVFVAETLTNRGGGAA